MATRLTSLRLPKAVIAIKGRRSNPQKAIAKIVDVTPTAKAIGSPVHKSAKVQTKIKIVIISMLNLLFLYFRACFLKISFTISHERKDIAYKDGQTLNRQ